MHPSTMAFVSWAPLGNFFDCKTWIFPAVSIGWFSDSFASLMLSPVSSRRRILVDPLRIGLRWRQRIPQALVERPKILVVSSVLNRPGQERRPGPEPLAGIPPEALSPAALQLLDRSLPSLFGFPNLLGCPVGED